MDYRYDWYQIKDFVYIDVFAKNKKQDDVTVAFTNNSVSITVKDGEAAWTKEVTNLFGEIVPDQSSFFVGRVKIEVKMKKVDNSNWENLTLDAVQHHTNTVPTPGLFSRRFIFMIPDV